MRLQLRRSLSGKRKRADAYTWAMPQVQFIIPLAADEVTLADGELSEIELAKTGTFVDPRYGKFRITQADFKKWIDNFKVLAIGDGRLGAPIDVDHSPEKEGKTEAVGWIKSLRIAGDRLLGKVQWNSVGAELVKDKRYAYISPSYHEKYKDESGKDYGTVLRGAALTNRPFLRMATVNLSEGDVEVQTPEGDAVMEATLPRISTTQVSDTPRQMLTLDDIKTKLGLPEDADDATILAAIEKSESGEDSRTLAQRAEEEGKVLMDADKFAELSANASAGAAAAKELAETRFSTAWQKALSEGKVTPAQLEDWQAQYDAVPDSTLKLLDGLESKVNVEPKGHGGGRVPAAVTGGYELEAGESLDDSRAAVDARAQEIAVERGISYIDAAAIAETEVNV